MAKGGGNSLGLPQNAGLYIQNRLAEVEVAYETLKEAETDWEAFRREPNPIFDSFCDDIFGDG